MKIKKGLFLASVIFLVSCSNYSNYNYSREIKKDLVFPKGFASIKNDLGNLKIERQSDLSSDKISINAKVKAIFYEADLNKVNVSVTEDFDTSEILIETKYFEMFNVNSPSVDINLNLPANCGVKSIETVSGNFNISKINEIGKLKTVSGDISIYDSKTIKKVSTNSGNITITQAGRIEEVSTISGNVTIDSNLILSIDVKSGDINVRTFDQSDDMNIETISGNINVSLNPSLNTILKIKTKTVSGKITNNAGDVVYGENAKNDNNAVTKSVNISTVSGNITVNRL